MDIVGFLGYSGQETCFLDDDHFAYTSGRSVCVVDMTKGPREMLWRPTNGISKMCAHSETRRIALAPISYSLDIEIVEFPSQILLHQLKNPANACILDMAFTRSGDRLFALSDPLDHRVFAWDVTTSRVLFLAELSGLFDRICLDPLDHTRFLLTGETGASLGAVVEVIDVCTVKFSPVRFIVDPIESISTETLDHAACCDGGVLELNSLNSSSQTITFSLWMPGSRAILGVSNGSIVEINLSDGTVHPILQLRTVNVCASTLSPVFPSSATLSATHLIIGSSSGDVLWYELDDIGSNGTSNPVQALSLTGKVTSLTADPSYLHIVGGTTTGIISRFSIEVAEKRRDELEDENLDVVDRVPHSEEESIRIARTEMLQAMQAGAILCCKSFFAPILSTSENVTKSSATYCSFFVTGSHSGSITFWRQPAVDCEPITREGTTTGSFPGIRRSAPRALKAIATAEIGSLGPITNVSAATSIEFLPFNQKSGHCLMIAGTIDGFVETWRMCLFDTEEEDEEDHGAVEDDEDEGIVKLFLSKTLRRRMFKTPLSSISVSKEENKFYSVALSSAFDCHVFVLKVPSDFAFNASVSYSINIPSSSFPCSLSWNGQALWTICTDGMVYSFSPSRSTRGDGDFCNPTAAWQTRLTSVSTACACKNDSLLLTSSDISLMRTITLPSTSVSAQMVSTNPGKILTFPEADRDYDVHGDIIVCSVLSANGAFLANGSAHGCVQIWAVESSALKLINRLHLHSAAVLCLSFSADSSLLLTCGADGSIFIATVDEPTRSHLKTALGDSKYFERIANPEDPFPRTSAETDIFVDDISTWIEKKNVEVLENLRDGSRQKTADIKASVEDVALRLRILLERNEGRTDLEKLDRSDFIVDMRGRDDVLKKIEQALFDTKVMYDARNTWNELIAARIREKCWDVMDAESRRIFPFLHDSCGDFKYVSSYSIQTCSNVFLRQLSVVKRMRALELRAQRVQGHGVSQKLVVGNNRTVWFTSLLGCPQTVSWIANDGTRWASRDIAAIPLRGEKKDALTDAAKDKGADKKDVPLPVEVHQEFKHGAEDDEEQSLASLDGDREIDENDVLNLLYPPQAIRTPVQKRIQITLLTEVARALRIKFNDYIEELGREKEDVIASIESRNTRIKSILEELKIVDEYFVPKLLPAESKGAYVSVSDEDMQNKPYESEIARAARLKAEEEKQRRDAERDKEDARSRALDEMMRGTLDVKRDTLAEATAMQRPAWMEELSLSEMTEVQLREVESFEAKLKAFQEDQIKYRKGLEQELKKLKNESFEACKAFDDKLLIAAKLKIVIQRELLTQELYIARLSLNLSKHEQSRTLLRNIEKQMRDVKGQMDDVLSRMDKFNMHVQDMKTKLDTLIEEDRALDRNFKKEFPPSHEHAKALKKLYYDRTYPKSADDDKSVEIDADESDLPQAAGGHSQSRSKLSNSRGKTRGHGGSRKAMAASSAANDHQHSRKAASSRMRMSKGRSSLGGGKEKLGPMQEAARALQSADKPDFNDRDPFFLFMAQKEKTKRSADVQFPLPITRDEYPEDAVNIDNVTWSRLLELRRIRIEKQVEVKRLSIDFAEVKHKVDDLSLEGTVLETRLSNLKLSREEALQTLRSLETNLELLVCLRQGQDEVDRDEVVTDYGRAMLIPIPVVHKFNARIKELGREKISVLARIKQFRRKINLLDWEAKHLNFEARHFEEYFTDLQLLRVTRELQHVIRDGADAEQAKERLEKVGARKDFMLKDGEARASKLRKANDALRRQLIERQDESNNLEAKIRELRVQLSARKSVKQSRDEARGVGGDPISVASAKMKKVVARRQLVDAARVQAEEIEFLRKELDRLRQRTFPSFVRAVKTRNPPNPDERW